MAWDLETVYRSCWEIRPVILGKVKATVVDFSSRSRCARAPTSDMVFLTNSVS